MLVASGCATTTRTGNVVPVVRPVTVRAAAPAGVPAGIRTETADVPYSSFGVDPIVLSTANVPSGTPSRETLTSVSLRSVPLAKAKDDRLKRTSSRAGTYDAGAPLGNETPTACWVYPIGRGVVLALAAR